MHEQLRQFFDEHQQPTHIKTEDVHGLALPVLQLAMKIQQQVMLYRHLLLTAKMVDHDGELDPKFERLKQKLKALESTATSFIELGEQLADGFTMWDKIMAEDAALLDAWSTRRNASTSSAGAPVAEAIG